MQYGVVIPIDAFRHRKADIRILRDWCPHGCGHLRAFCRCKYNGKCGGCGQAFHRCTCPDKSGKGSGR